MDFTREPIIETVITPKEGCKLVVRSSKSAGQEEYFVDAVEVVSFGHSFFFRSLERPKSFLVPATDYEILEVREARMVLKNVGIDRTIKIAGGREAQMRPTREQMEKVEPIEEQAPIAEQAEMAAVQQPQEKPIEARIDKKRDRRRSYRRRRGREGVGEEEQEAAEKASPDKTELLETIKAAEGEPSPLAQQVATTSILTSLLPPPPTLISETISRYKDNILFKDAFYSKEESKRAREGSQSPQIPLEQPEYPPFEESREEEIYKERKQQEESEESGEQHRDQHDVPEENDDSLKELTNNHSNDYHPPHHEEESKND